MRVYVAGPYSHPDPCENTYRAVQMGNLLVGMGHTPYIPHLTHFWHTMTPKPRNFWYAYDLEWMKQCDWVLRFPGKSSGADNEVREALAANMPVFFDVADIPNDCA